MTLVKKLMIKILNLKLVTVKISKYKNFFAKGFTPNWPEEFFVIKKVKNTVPWAYVIKDINVEEIIGTFYENEFQKTNQNEQRIEKVIKRKGDKLYVRWKGYDNAFNNWRDKKDLVLMSEYFPEPKSLGRKMNLELDLSNYATKTDLKNATGIDTSSLAKKIDLSSLKPNADKLDDDKLKKLQII